MWWPRCRWFRCSGWLGCTNISGRWPWRQVWFIFIWKNQQNKCCSHWHGTHALMMLPRENQLSSSWKFWVSQFWQLFSRRKDFQDNFSGEATTKNCCCFFHENCFNINYLHQAYPNIEQMRITIMFLLHFLIIRRNCITFVYRNFLFDRSKCTIFSLNLLKT